MELSALLKSIAVSLKNKLLVASAVVVFGLVYCYATNPLIRLEAILLLLVSSELLVILWVPTIFDMYKGSFKLIFKKSARQIPCDRIDFLNLIENAKVKLNKKKPITIQQGLNNAYYSPLTDKIVIGQMLLDKLSKQEQYSMLLHEIAHAKYYHFLKMFLGLTSVPYFLYFIAEAKTPAHIVSYLIYAASAIIVFVICSWNCEFSADNYAAKHGGVKNTISLLEKLAPPKEWKLESITHPSIYLRIKRLQRQFAET